jgi:hypothetical protein
MIDAGKGEATPSRESTPRREAAVDHASYGPMELQSDPTSRIARVRFAPSTKLGGKEGAALVDGEAGARAWLRTRGLA